MTGKAAVSLPRRSRRSRLLLPACLGLVGMSAFSLWPRGERLGLFTSRPFTLDGRTVRYQLLLPDGWMDDTETTGGQYTKPANFLLRPRPRLSWLPASLRRWIGVGGEADTYVIVSIGGPKLDLDNIEVDESGAPHELCSASWETSSPLRGFITYAAVDRPQFRRNYRQICESFRVIPP